MQTLKRGARTVWGYYFRSPDDETVAGRAVRVHGPVMHRMTLGYILLTIGICVGLYLNAQQTREVKKIAKKVEAIAKLNTTAVCRQRRNYELSALQTEDFLADGHHIPGVEDALLLRGIRNNRNNAKALSGVRCSYKLPVPLAVRGKR